MADSRSGAESVQDKPATSCHTREQRGYQKLSESCLKDLRVHLNRLLLGQQRVNCSIYNNMCNGLEHTKHVKSMCIFLNDI